MKKFLFDLFPLILFFIAYRAADIYTATAVAMAASVAQIVWLKARQHVIETTHWINLTVIVVFGGATLAFQSDAFIKWKPTVLYWVFAAVLVGSRIILRRNLIRHLLQSQVNVAEPVWERLNLAWAGFFALAGVANLYVAFSGHFSVDQWVNFKVFGLMGLLFAFAIAQAFWLARHMNPQAQASDNTDASQS